MRVGIMFFALLMAIGSWSTPAEAQFLDPGERSTVTGSDPQYSTGVWNRETTGITSRECGNAGADCNVATFAGLVADLELCILDPFWTPENGGCLGPCRVMTREELIAEFSGARTFAEALQILENLLLFVCGDVEIEIDVYKAGGPNQPPQQQGPNSTTTGAVTVNTYDQFNFGSSEIRDALRNSMGACAVSAGLGFVRYTDANPEGVGHMTTLTGAWNGYGHPSGYDPGLTMFDPATGGHVHGHVTGQGGHNYVNYGTAGGAPALWHLEELIVIRVINCEDDCYGLEYDWCLMFPSDAETDPNSGETGEGNRDESDATQDGNGESSGG